jgi:hypothetical protein
VQLLLDEASGEDHRHERILFTPEFVTSESTNGIRAPGPLKELSIGEVSHKPWIRTAAGCWAGDGLKQFSVLADVKICGAAKKL